MGGHAAACARPCWTTTPCGRARSAVQHALPGPVPASWPIRARFHHIYSKVSQNDEVSIKYPEKASHSPYSQKGLEKSPLEIPGFPFSLAFSHKELMVPKERYLIVLCQNDEVSTECTPECHAKWSPDTPTDHASKLAPVIRSSSGSARYSQRPQFWAVCT